MNASSSSRQQAKQDIGAAPVIDAVVRARRFWWVKLGLSGLSATLLGLLFFFNPSQHSFYPFCAFHRMTGMQCPGCGGLRAVHHFLHGEVITAFRYNQLVVLAIPVVTFLLAQRWWRGPQAQNNPRRVQACWAWLAFALLLGFWIVRNLPLEIFKLPAG